MIQELAFHSVGGVVTSAQPLMVGVPQSSGDPTKLTAEMRVANQDIGFVNASQIASVKLAIFPYARYGTVHAQAKLIHLCEWFYGAHAPDTGFDPEFPVALDAQLRVSTWRAHHLLALEQCDVAIAPTQWQKSQFPATYQPKIQVLHEGIATDVLGPDPQAQLTLPNGQVLKAGDPVVTYVGRNLEPYRGFHVFMRSLPALLAAHPNCQVLIVGGDEVSYGRAPGNAKSWREALLREVNIDTSRVHFLGKLPYAQYRRVLQVSAVHVYLTYPFVLSWSLLKALACGCAVVASDTAPVSEVIRHGENGLLVDFFDGAQLVETVKKVLGDPTGIQAMRLAARKLVKERFAQAAGTAGYLVLMGCDSAIALKSNVHSKVLQEVQKA